MDDYDFMSEIGIDPGSIDYGNAGSALSNEGLWDQIQGNDWTPENWEMELGGNDGIYGTGDQNLGALSQLQEPEVAGVAEERDMAGMDKLAKAASKADMRDSFQKVFNLKTVSDGSTDWLDPKNIDKLVKLGLGLGNLLGSRKQSTAANATQQNAALQAQLQQQLRNAWTPQQAQWANSFFQTPINPNRGVQYASDMKSPIVPGRGYADGGKVNRGFGGYGDPAAMEVEEERGATPMQIRLQENIFDRTRRRHWEEAGLIERPHTLQRGTERSVPTKMLPITDLLRSLPQLFKSLGFSEGPAQAYPPGYADGGEVGALTAAAPFVGYVEGDTPGQADLIDAKLAAGEYVFDADTVAALGDGNNAAGARALDQMREEIRSMKRGAPAGEIPPALHGAEG